MASQPTVPHVVRQFWDSLDPEPNGVVAAVSGGADSVALVLALKEIGVAPLVVAHLNHGLRGDESDSDAAFVAELAERLKLPFRCDRRDIRADSGGDNLEAAARAARYGWLAAEAETLNIDCVATGHTEDDQAETVLFRLLRGTGLRGFAGIRPRRTLAPAVQLVRPLLRVPRAAIVDYLRGVGQSWREDSSNRDRRFTRNRIRYELLPLLKSEFNPRVCEALVRFGEQAAHCHRIAERRIGARIAIAELPRAGRNLVFHRHELEGMSRSSLAGFWHAIWLRESWPMADMGDREYKRIASWCHSQSAALELPDGIRIKRYEMTIVAGPVKTRE